MIPINNFFNNFLTNISLITNTPNFPSNQIAKFFFHLIFLCSIVIDTHTTTEHKLIIIALCVRRQTNQSAEKSSYSTKRDDHEVHEVMKGTK